MKKNSLLLLVAMPFLMLQVTSCGKINDIFHKPTEPVVKLCHVSRLTLRFNSSSPAQTFDFTYDFHGNPHSAITSIPNQFASQYYFYDKKNRLTDVISTGNPITGDTLPARFAFQIYTTYTYDNNSKGLQPITDTLHSFGFYDHGVITRSPTGPFPYVTNYNYDAEGRISKTTTRYNTSPSSAATIENYNYDERGNRIRSGIVYDDNMNVSRTNPVWMFIDKDYSRNNRAVADTYNAQGLPEKITRGGHFLGTTFSEGIFTYTCDAK